MKPLQLFAACTAVALLAPQTARSQSADAQSALAAVQRMFDGMRTADSAMVRSVFSDGARFASVAPSAVWRGRMPLAAWFKVCCMA